MIWIIASVPFWGIATLLLLAAGATIVASFFHKGSQSDFNKMFAGAILFSIGAGLAAIIAAKLCS